MDPNTLIFEHADSDGDWMTLRTWNEGEAPNLVLDVEEASSTYGVEVALYADEVTELRDALTAWLERNTAS